MTDITINGIVYSVEITNTVTIGQTVSGAFPGQTFNRYAIDAVVRVDGEIRQTFNNLTIEAQGHHIFSNSLINGASPDLKEISPL